MYKKRKKYLNQYIKRYRYLKRPKMLLKAFKQVSGYPVIPDISLLMQDVSIGNGSIDSIITKTEIDYYAPILKCKMWRLSS